MNHKQSNYAIFYKLASSFANSFITFSVIALVVIGSLLVAQLISGTNYASPLYYSYFSWTDTAIAVLPIIALLSISYAVAMATVNKLTYKVKLSDAGLMIKKGLMQSSVEFIPYSAIKLVESTASPFQRLFNFRRVSIDYGGWQPEELDVMTADNAKKLRTAVVDNAVEEKIYNGGEK